MRFAICILLTLSWGFLSAQTLTIKGRVVDKETSDGIGNAEVSVVLGSAKSSTDSNGYFEISGVSPGFYVLTAKADAFKTAFSSEMLFTFDKSPFVTIECEPEVKQIGSANITKSSLQRRNAESPLSNQQLSIREIERNPGGNRDISKIVQSLPGVISIPGFRNDIIIRGGAPVENKFYLDGIEIPIINHFQTQGSTGGPVGLLNVNFIKDVNFYTGAFPVNLANGTSAVVDFRQMEGNKEKPKYRFTLGSSDVGFTADGPIGKKINFIASARQSYLQGLFSVLKLPFLPNFIDYQARVNYKINDKSNLTIIGLGAIDFFRLNLKVNEGITDSLKIKENRYLLGVIPDFGQTNYTVGAIYTHYKKRDKQQLFISRSFLKNTTVKYRNNDDTKIENKLLDYVSTEGENKLRFENSRKIKGINNLSGAGLEYAQFTSKTFNKITTPFGVQTINFNSALNLVKYNVFTRFSGMLNNGVSLAAGFRLDGNNLNTEMANLFLNPTISLSASIPLMENLYLNFNTGQFRQLPAYTVLGFKDSNNVQINATRIRNIVCRQLVAGFQLNQGTETKITLEGFYKHYSKYPFVLNDSISLGNLGADFATVGNEPIVSTGTGKAYGVEFLAQRRSKKGLYGIASYTLVWSFFEDKFGKLIPSAWDSRHTVVLTGGLKLKRNWEIGAKWRFISGRPFTPYNEAQSLLKSNWDVKNQAIFDYNQLNGSRLSNFTQLDFRVDKVWYFKRSSLNLYFDIQNLLNNQSVGPNTLIAAQNADGSLVTDPLDPARYKADFIPNTNGTLLPTIGIIFDF